MSKRTASEIIQIRALISKTNGHFFKVVFVKRSTGEVREMTARIGVKKYTNGIGLKYDAKSKNLLPVWVSNENLDGAEAYRMVDLETILEIKANGKELLYA